MSLFGRIKSAVVGNPVTKEYELGRHVASAGPGLLWKVYSAVKKTTRQVQHCTCMYMYKMYMYMYTTDESQKVCISNSLWDYSYMYMYIQCTVHVQQKNILIYMYQS